MTIQVRIKETKALPLNALTLGQFQVRTRHVAKNLEDLVHSISTLGLLQPIVVCPADVDGTYEILCGQRRFLACQEIGLDDIMAVILDRKVSQTEAKVISLTENAVRENMSKADLIDVCSYLYTKYQSAQEVHNQTGISVANIKKYVTVARLPPEIKDAVGDGEITLDAAMRAAEACDTGGVEPPDVEEILKYARALSPLAVVQQKEVVKAKRSNPKSDIAKVMDIAGENRQIQIVTTLSAKIHESLQRYADKERTTQDAAAAGLIIEGLDQAGYDPQ